MKESHPKRDLEIYCRKCGRFTWHAALNAQWMKCLDCGDHHDLADPGTQVAESVARGQREKRV